MCGIVYMRRSDNRPARKTVLKRYTKQKHRGSDGFGYVSLGADNAITGYNRHQVEKKVRETLSANDSSHILFHHRYPTSTANVPESAHPIVVDNKELQYVYYVVHNGIISNDEELNEIHEALGYAYNTKMTQVWATATGKTYIGAEAFNDSECLAIELARTIEGKQREVKAEGAAAYIVLQVDRITNKAIALIYGTNGGNPLTIDTRGGHLVIASEGGTALLENISYRQDLETGALSVLELHMKPYETYKPSASGYYPLGYGKSAALDDRDEEDYVPDSEARDSYKTVDDMHQLDTLKQYIKENEADQQIAKDAEEWGELEALQIEHAALCEELCELEVGYAVDRSDVPF